MGIRGDRGQTLFLAPIGFLIVLVLGVATLEVGAVHLRQRQLSDLAESIASDAATVGFDIDTFRDTGTLAIDATAANSVAGPAIAISNLPEATATGVTVTSDAEPTVEVTLSYRYDYIFGRGLFGGGTDLTATGTAALVPSP